MKSKYSIYSAEQLAKKHAELQVAKTMLAEELRNKIMDTVSRVDFYNMKFDISNYYNSELDTVTLSFQTNQELQIWEVGTVENISGFQFARYEKRLICCEDEDENKELHLWWFESNPNAYDSKSRWSAK